MSSPFSIRNFTAIALAALIFACPLLAEDKPKDQDPDVFRLYQVGGRTWVIKSTPGAATDQNTNITYMRYEVLEVHEKHAVVSRIRVESNRKPAKGVQPSISEIQFKADQPPFKMAEQYQKTGSETRKVGNLSLECDIYTSSTTASTPSKYWCAKRYPGLVVREEAMNGVDELVEFDAFSEDDPPPKKGKPKEEPKQPADGLNFALYKAKRFWIIRERSGEGVEQLKKFEVVKVDATGADLKITAIDEQKKPLKGAKPEVKRVEFTEAGKAFIEPPGGKKIRSEKRKFGSGVMSCDVYETSVDGKKGQVWMAQRYPGLTVRISLGEAGKDGGAELVEFKD